MLKSYNKPHDSSRKVKNVIKKYSLKIDSIDLKSQ